MFLTKKNSDNVYVPSWPADLEESQKVKVGSEVKVSRARNPLFHRKGMALISMLYENQSTIENKEVFRKITIINCGYYDEVKNKDGVVVPIAHSLSFDNMDASTFEKFYEALLDVAVIKLQSSPEIIQKELENFM